MTINWDNFKCRCSGIHKIMANSRSNPQLTEKQAKDLADFEQRSTLTEKQTAEMARLLILKENSTKVVLSDTAIEYLIEYYSLVTEGMVSVDKELSYVQQLEKGKLCEEEAITMLSRVEGVVYRKNEERISNDFLCGEPDVFSGTSIYEAQEITDLKCLWDYPGFLLSVLKAAENGYKDQIGGYCDMSGAKKGKLSRVLVTMPPQLQFDQAQRLIRKLGCISDESPEFKKEWPILERSMNFDHIDIKKRVFRLPVDPFTPERRQSVYDRVKVCREWLWNFDEQYKNLNK